MTYQGFFVRNRASALYTKDGFLVLPRQGGQGKESCFYGLG
jgi:hypothetical protein